MLEAVKRIGFLIKALTTPLRMLILKKQESVKRESVTIFQIKNRSLNQMCSRRCEVVEVCVLLYCLLLGVWDHKLS